ISTPGSRSIGRAPWRRSRVKNALKLGYFKGFGCAASLMFGRKPRTKLRINRFLNGRRRMRVTRSTRRDRKCCGNACCRATNNRSRSDGAGKALTGTSSGLAEVGGCTGEILGQLGSFKGRSEYTGDLPAIVEQKNDRGMIHRVVPSGQLDLVHRDAEL